MQGERPGSIEGSDAHRESEGLNEEEREYARFTAAYNDARRVVDRLSESDKPVSEFHRAILSDALGELEHRGRQSFAGSISSERQSEIDGRFADLAQLHAAWDEAFERLPDSSNVAMLTLKNEAVQELEEYLASHREELTHEEVFFLQTSIEIRKIKSRLYGRPS